MISLLLLLAGILLLVLAKLYEAHWSMGLGLELHFERDQVHAGEQVLFSEIIQNRKRLPIPVLEIGFRLPKGISFVDAPNVLTSDYCYKRDIFSLLGMEQITRRFVMDCQARGHYCPDQISLISYSPLKTRRYILEQQPEGELYVYPRRANLTRVLASLETILGEIASSRHLYEDPFSFSGIRPYVPTDPMKTINWKATAKTGSLQVNTYTSTQNLELVLYLDVHDPYVVPKTALVEEAISLCSSLAERYLQAGMQVGFYVNAQGPSRDQKGPILREAKRESDSGQASGSGQAPDSGQTPDSDQAPEALTPCPYYSLPLQRGREQLSLIQRYLTRSFSSKECLPFEDLLSLLSQKRKAGARDRALVHVFVSMRSEPELARAIEAFLPKGAAALWIIPVPAGEKSPQGPKTWIPICQQEVSP